MERTQETAFPFRVFHFLYGKIFFALALTLRFKSSRNIQNAVFYFVILFNIMLSEIKIIKAFFINQE